MVYDTLNVYGAIEKAEVFDAIYDYYDGKITKDDVITVIGAYFGTK